MSLPVDEVLPQLTLALKCNDAVVLEAPPGAGKTTRAPIALWRADSVVNGKILVLEPRRIATRSAAKRMADLLGEPIGKTVGYRIRGESKVSSYTQIEVITEGILIRLLQSDPSLSGTGLVIFDEFHERNIDSDLGLALSLYAREVFREPHHPLKLLVMSATLDGQTISRLLADAPVISSMGRQYPVDIIYTNSSIDRYCLEHTTANTIKKVLREHDDGDVLVFLPGKREISKTRERLDDFVLNSNIAVHALYGELSLEKQKLAIAPAGENQRKIILATAIAESSLTIEGVRIVIDCGFSRLPEFDARTAMTRLTTRLSSKASATQRAGRAGRVTSGVCYRLWAEAQHDTRPAFTAAEILQADLAPLVLTLYRFGVDNPDELRWLDKPAPGAWSQAETLLQQLGALTTTPGDAAYRLTSHGERMAEFAVHPRLAHMLITAQQYNAFDIACELAAFLSSNDPLRNQSADIAECLRIIRHNKNKYRHISQLAMQLKRLEDKPAHIDNPPSIPMDNITGLLIANAYPDRIARRRSTGGYQLSNGRIAKIRDDDPLINRDWLAVAHLGGTSNDATDYIYLAAELDENLFEDELLHLVDQETIVRWPASEKALTAELQHRVGQIIVHTEASVSIDPAKQTTEVIRFIRSNGLQLLPWTNTSHSLRQRVTFARSEIITQEQLNAWPDLSDNGLTDTLEDWLAPFAVNISHINHFSTLNMQTIVESLLTWDTRQQLETIAPTHYQVPSGSKIRIDYSTSVPTLAVKLQEMLGASEHPTIGNDYPLKVSLLSPANRPIQLTQDLPGFWGGSYAQVRKEMKARYPKHYWPDDPARARASRRTTGRDNGSRH